MENLKRCAETKINPNNQNYKEFKIQWVVIIFPVGELLSNSKENFEFLNMKKDTSSEVKCSHQSEVQHLIPDHPITSVIPTPALLQRVNGQLCETCSGLSFCEQMGQEGEQNSF